MSMWTWQVQREVIVIKSTQDHKGAQGAQCRKEKYGKRWLWLNRQLNHRSIRIDCSTFFPGFCKIIPRIVVQQTRTQSVITSGEQNYYSKQLQAIDESLHGPLKSRNSKEIAAGITDVWSVGQSNEWARYPAAIGIKAWSYQTWCDTFWGLGW